MARLNEKGMELVKAISSQCETPSDVTKLLKELFAGTLEQMLEAEMDTHLVDSSVNYLPCSMATMSVKSAPSLRQYPKQHAE